MLGLDRQDVVTVTACAVLGIGMASVYVSQTPKTYSSEADLFVEARAAPNSGALYDRGRFAQERVKSYVPLVATTQVLTGVIGDLKLSLTPTQLAAKLDVTADPETVLLKIVARDHSPTVATELADATARRFASYVSKLEGTEDGQAAVQTTLTQPVGRNETLVGPRPVMDLSLGGLLGIAIGAVLARSRGFQTRTVASSARRASPSSASNGKVHATAWTISR